MTREEAIKAVGQKYVEQAEKENCEFILRGSRNDPDEERWEGRSDVNEDGEYCAAVYYMDRHETEVEDLGSCNWVIDHYEVR